MSGCEYLGKIQRFLNNIISTKIGKKNEATEAVVWGLQKAL